MCDGCKAAIDSYLQEEPYGQELFPIPVPPLPGLLVKAFRGEASILEVECTGDMLSADVDVFQMTLYTTADNEVVAYVNPLKNECLTSRSFSSCVIDEKDSRRTRLRSLVIDLGSEEARWYGCNVSSSQARSPIKVTSWSVVVKRLRE